MGIENLRKQFKKIRPFKLNLTEEFYLHLIKLSFDAIVIHKNGKIVYVNPAGVKMIRAKSAKDLIGKPILDFIHPSSRALAKARLHEMLIKKGVAKPVEEKFIRLDKTVLETSVTSLLFPYHDGRAFLSVVRDLTKQKKCENELSRLTTIIKTTDDAIVSLGLNGKLSSWNKGAEKLYGYNSKEMVGKSISKIYPPEKKEEFKKLMNKIKSGMMVKNLKTERIRKDGKKVNIILTVSPVYDKKGRIIGASHVSQDFSKLKQTLGEMPRLASVTQYTSDGVFITDIHGIIQYVNPAFEKITGLSKKEVLGLTPRIIKSGQHDKSFYQKLWSTILSGKTFRSTMTNMNRYGNLFYVDHTITPVKDEAGNITNFVGIWKDITEQMQFERRKDDFISIASHELKTPLTSISIYNQALENILAKKKDNEYSRYLGKINIQINRLTNLINQLLDISKIQAGKLVFNKEYVDLNFLISDITESMQLTTTKHSIKLKGKIKRKIYCDKERINQVVVNLLSNAIKYSPGGGEIIVSLQNDDNNILVSVNDSGIGIPKKYQHRIFERFFRAGIAKYTNYPGMGIGLYLSSEIIKQHAGKMWLESIEGQGSTFYFNLPLKLN